MTTKTPATKTTKRTRSAERVLFTEEDVHRVCEELDICVPVTAEDIRNIRHALGLYLEGELPSVRH